MRRDSALRRLLATALVTVVLLAACAPPENPGPGGAGAAPAATAAPEIGKPAPNFVLTATDGQPVELARLRGRPVIVNFWATWCAPCRAEMPELQDFYDDQHPKGLEIIAVDIQESAEQVIAYRQMLGINFPTVLDNDGTVTRQYLVRGVPTTFLIDAQGTIRDINIGPVNRKLLNEKLAKIA